MTTSDLFEDKLLHEVLEAQTSAFAPDESVFARFVDNWTDVVLVMRPDAGIVYANKIMRALLSIEVSDLGSVNLFDFAPPDFEAPLRAIWESVLQVRPGDAFDEDVPFGSHGWVNMAVQTWAGDDGNLRMVTAVGRDRTESYLAKRELEDLNRRLAESNRDLQDFAYVASHDLQEPLRKIIAFSDRLSKKYADNLDDQARDYLARVQNAGGRMQKLIEDLLSFSRVNTDGREFVDSDLNVVVAEVLSDLEVAISESGAQVHVGHLPHLAVDPTQMRQLFQNLIANAIKFRRAGVPPVIRVGAERDGSDDGKWRFTVADNGIGFDQKYAAKIFTVFQRLHGRQEYEGSGVGLSVCRRIAERHHGTLEASSAAGEGATFIVTL